MLDRKALKAFANSLRKARILSKCDVCGQPMDNPPGYEPEDGVCASCQREEGHMDKSNLEVEEDSDMLGQAADNILNASHLIVEHYANAGWGTGDSDSRISDIKNNLKDLNDIIDHIKGKDIKALKDFAKTLRKTAAKMSNEEECLDCGRRLSQDDLDENYKTCDDCRNPSAPIDKISSLRKKAAAQEGDRFTMKPNAVVGNEVNMVIELSDLRGIFIVVTGPDSGSRFDLSADKFNELLHTGFIKKVEDPQD